MTRDEGRRPSARPSRRHRPGAVPAPLGHRATERHPALLETAATPGVAWRFVVPALVMAAAAACVAGFVYLPQGMNEIPLQLGLGLSFLACILGPLVRRPRPKAAWGAAMVGGAAMLATLAIRTLRPLDGVFIGPVELGEMFFIAGNLALIVWLTLLAQHISGGNGRNTALDTATASVGMLLALWTLTLAPLSSEEAISRIALFSVVPLIDVILALLALHLAITLKVRTASVAWLLTGFVVLLIGDVDHMIAAIRGVEINSPLSTLYLFAIAAIALAMIHPSITGMNAPARGAEVRATARPTALVIVSFSPFFLASFLPADGLIDAGVRAVLISVLATLLFARHIKSMTALARSKEESHYRATHDPLTGLLNRGALMAELDRVLRADSRRGWATTLLYLDCDNFKQVNDTWGHHAGDTLLRDLAQRLVRALPAGSLIARLGGDEFVVLASMPDVKEAPLLARTVRAVFTDPLRILPGRTHPVTPSIGVASASRDAPCTPDELLGRADAAMYESKQQGRGRAVFFGATLAERAHARSAVGERLGRVADTAPFGVLLQPVMVGPGYASLLGWEAHPCWDDDELGSVPADVFTPVAENLGLSAVVFTPVLRRACREFGRLREVYPDAVLSINVVTSQLLDPAFAELVIETVDGAGVPRRSLWLEVSEAVLASNGSMVIDTVRELRDAGIRICVDDFGVGHISIHTLTTLPVDVVKLDGSLIADVDRDDEARGHLAAVIRFLRTLKTDAIVAEGVETHGQAVVLRDLQCSGAQGHLFGSPAPSADVLARLRRRALTAGV